MCLCLCLSLSLLAAIVLLVVASLAYIAEGEDPRKEKKVPKFTEGEREKKFTSFAFVFGNVAFWEAHFGARPRLAQRSLP